MSFFRHLFVHSWTDVLVPVAYHGYSAFRAERKCIICNKKQINIEQFNPRVIRAIRQRYGLLEKDVFLDYEKGDSLDLYTTYILTGKLDE